MKEINLKLTVDEANVMLQALGNLPYLQVHQLIEKIQSQAGQQLNGTEQQKVAATSSSKKDKK